MAYNITRADGTNFLVLNDNVINRDYSVTFVGKMVPNYGQAVNTNFLRLLENSASSAQPLKPVPGQLWYDAGIKKLKFYTGTNFHTLDSIPPNTLGTTAYLSSNTLGDYIWVNDKTLKNNLFPAPDIGGIPYDKITLKGCIATSANLPSTGAQIGDLYIDQNCQGDSWVYNGCSPDSATCVRGFFNAANQTGFLKRNPDGTTSYVTADSLISDILPAGRNNQILFNLNKGIKSSPNFTWDGTQLIVSGKIYTTGTNNSIAPGAAGSRDLKKYIDDFDYTNADPKGGVMTENQVPLYADFKFSIGGSGLGVFALSLEKNYPTMFFHAITPAGIISPFRAFKFNEQGLWIFDSEPVVVNFSLTTERVRAIFNMGTFFAYIQLVDKTTGAETRRVLVKTNNSGKPSAWTLYLDVTTFVSTANLFLYVNPYGTINGTIDPATGIDPDDRLLTLDLVDPMILKVYSIPVSGTAAPVLLRQQIVLDGATDVSFTDFGGGARTNSNGYTSLNWWGYQAFGVCFPFTWNKFTEQFIFVGGSYGTFAQGTGSGEQGFGATISWKVPRSWMIDGTGPAPTNLVPVNTISGRRYHYFSDSTWNSATGGMSNSYFSSGYAVGIATDENSRYISLGFTIHFGNTKYIYYRKWSAETVYPVIGGAIPAPVLTEDVPIIDESPWSKNLYGNAGFIIGSHATLYVNSAKHGLLTVSTDFSSGATARFISQAGTNNAVKLNTLGWETEYARTAFTSTVLASPGWTGDFSFYHTGTTVKSDGTPVYYIARAGRRVFTVGVAGTPWDYGAKKATPQARTYTDAGVSVPAMPATIGSITNIVAEPSCFWDGNTTAPVFWHIVRGTNPVAPAGLNATGTPLATNMLYVAKCVSGTWSNIYGPFLVGGIAAGNGSFRNNANSWYLHNGSHLLTRSGIIMHAGINVPVLGGTSFYYLRFDTNTNTTVSEGGSPFFGVSTAFGGTYGYAGISYGYSTVLGYYQMSGHTSYIGADIRSSKNMRNAALGTTDPDFTEAQWFANSGYNIGAICQGQVGLGVSIKPFPMLLGGYQINIADTLLPLLPNQPRQNIYVRKTPTDRLSNEVYSSTEDEPSGFTKQLIATVVTNDEFVTTAVAKPVGISIPPNDAGGTRYLSITDGVCGWVRASDIVSTGGGVTTGYTLPTASTTVLGGVKVDGTSISISSGVISAASTGPIAKLNFSTDPLSPALTVNLAVGANVVRVAGSTAGRYLVTFTSARADANYVAIASLGFNASNSPPNISKDNVTHFILNQTASGFEVYVNDCHNSSPTPMDTDNIGIVVFA
jgi:hypothetical protein